jgi:hypothetical protein
MTVVRDPLPLPLAVGRAVREMRDVVDVSADEVARAARDLGLKSWQRSIVAGIETGRRGLTAEELLLLPYVLTNALGHPVSLRDLLPAPVRLGGTWADEADLAKLLTGRPVAETLAGQREAIKQAAVRLLADALKKRGANAAADAELAAAGEAEQIAARKLGVTALQVAVAARQRWGRSLTAERDRLVRERVPDDTPISSVRAVRGRITRNLVAELAEDLEEGRGRSSRSGATH